MQVKSIVESSKGSIRQYFRPPLSYHLALRSLFCLYLSDRFTQVLLHFTGQRRSSKSAHAWIWIIFCMLNTYGITTTKMKLFYSSNAVRPQGDTLKYTLFVLIYDLLNISLKSLTLLTATFYDWNIKEDFPGYTLLPLMYMSTSR